MPPTPRKALPPPPSQPLIPNFQSTFVHNTPFFYFLHKIDPLKATLTVEVIGPNLTYTFTHSHALRSTQIRLSEVAWALERKTVGFLSLVKNETERRILAWAESGHGLGRSGDLLDAPDGGPVLKSELWTRRVIHVGKLLGMNMRRSFDNANNSMDPSKNIDGIFQGSHVEAKLAVHGIWVMLENFNIANDLDNITKNDLLKLHGVKWADGTKPSFEVYFSRKNCPPCGTLVQGLSELTGIEIKLLWKERLTHMEYYKPPKNKKEAKKQKKAFAAQRDVVDFDDLVTSRAEAEHGCYSDVSISNTESDTSDDEDGCNPSEAIDVDGDAPRQAAKSSGHDADLTRDEADHPAASNNDKPMSALMRDRQNFMDEMQTISVKADCSGSPDHASRSGSSHQDPIDLIAGMHRELEDQEQHPKTGVDIQLLTSDQWDQNRRNYLPGSRQRPRETQEKQEIRKPLPAMAVEEAFPQIDGENRGSRHRRRFLNGEPLNRARSASPRRQPQRKRQREEKRPVSAVGRGPAVRNLAAVRGGPRHVSRVIARPEPVEASQPETQAFNNMQQRRPVSSASRRAAVRRLADVRGGPGHLSRAEARPAPPEKSKPLAQDLDVTVLEYSISSTGRGLTSETSSAVQGDPRHLSEANARPKPSEIDQLMAQALNYATQEHPISPKNHGPTVRSLASVRGGPRHLPSTNSRVGPLKTGQSSTHEPAVTNGGAAVWNPATHRDFARHLSGTNACPKVVETVERERKSMDDTEVIDLSSDDAEVPAPVQIEKPALPETSPAKATKDKAPVELEGATRPAAKKPVKTPVFIDLDGPDKIPTIPTPDVTKQPEKSPTRVLFPLPRLGFTQSTFPSPKPTKEVRPTKAQKPVQEVTKPSTTKLRTSYAANAQRTQVLHYPTPKASSEKEAVNNDLSAAPKLAVTSAPPPDKNNSPPVSTPKKRKSPYQPRLLISQNPQPVWPGPPESSLAKALKDEKERAKRPRLTAGNLNALNKGQV